MERAGSSLLPHDLSRMLGRSVALKGCAKPNFAHF
jgi:hypothetical protein